MTISDFVQGKTAKPGLQLRAFIPKEQLLSIGNVLPRNFHFISVCSDLRCARSRTTATSSSSPAIEEATHFDPVQATKAWLDSVPADQRAKSNAYFEGGYWLLLWNFLFGAAIAIFLLVSKFLAQLRDFTERLTGSNTLQVAICAVVYVLIVAILSFPLTFYQFFAREHQYGFATQTFGQWFVEQLIGLIVGLIAGSIALSILYAVFRHAPRSWWIWGTLVTVVLVVHRQFHRPDLRRTAVQQLQAANRSEN